MLRQARILSLQTVVDSVYSQSLPHLPPFDLGHFADGIWQRILTGLQILRPLPTSVSYPSFLFIPYNLLHIFHFISGFLQSPQSVFSLFGVGYRLLPRKNHTTLALQVYVEYKLLVCSLPTYVVLDSPRRNLQDSN